jgi:hypothetical protein
MQRNPVIRRVGEPCFSGSCPGQKLQDATGSGFSGGLEPDSSTSGYHRGFLRKCHGHGRTESGLCEFPEADSRRRGFIPWMSSGIVSVFPFSKAIQSPASRTPLFYVGHMTAELGASEPDAEWVHLVGADTKHNSRAVQITSGWSAFSFQPGFTAREEIPLKFLVLSDTVYTIQPKRPLDNGEYPVIFRPSALRGFEFQIACSGVHCD